MFFCGSDLKALKFGNARISDDRVMGHEVGAPSSGRRRGEKFQDG